MTRRTSSIDATKAIAMLQVSVIATVMNAIIAVIVASLFLPPLGAFLVCSSLES